jgi:hypothetical protein
MAQSVQTGPQSVSGGFMKDLLFQFFKKNLE